MPLILSGNVASATAAGYDVENSCRFDDDSSAYMYKSLGTPTSQRKFTFSCWFKPAVAASNNCTLISWGAGSDNEFASIVIQEGTGYYLQWYLNDQASPSGSGDKRTTMLFRDPSAWYHLVCALDTEQDAGADRQKFYVNGVRITSFTEETWIAEDYDVPALASGETVEIGRRITSGSYHMDGYMAEVCFVDGQQLPPTDFGEFDSDSPTIWKPKDVSGLTFGNNGFYLDFKASDNLGNDANGGTDLTESGLTAEDQCTDSPTNNFATFNPLMRSAGATYREGNTYYAFATNWQKSTFSTFAPTAGKWYFEWRNEDNTAKEIAVSNSTFALDGQVQLSEVNADTYTIRESPHGVTWHTSNTAGVMMQDGSNIRTDVSPIQDDEIGIFAFDCATGKIWTGSSGTWDNSGDPAGDSNPSATWSTNFTVGEPTFFTFGAEGGNALQVNFGNPAWTISSSNADADGYGNFEYAVPSGFYALCSKNLAEYG